ncbi:MAG: sugar transferase [Cyanobacteria bacterium P01_F01_bin.86]
MSYLRYFAAHPAASIKTVGFVPPADPPKDIRSISGIAGLRRGVFLSWTRRLVLFSSDILSISLAWVLAQLMEGPIQSLWSVETVGIHLFLALSICLSLFSARNLYRPGDSRRDYPGVIKAQSLSAVLLLLVSYFYNPNHVVPRAQLLGFWGFSILFICAGRYAIDQLTHVLRLRGAMRYPAMIIADSAYQTRAKEIVKNEQRYRIATVKSAMALDRDRRERTFREIQRLGIAEVFVSWDAIRNRMYLGQRFQALGITLHVIPAEQEEVLRGANIHTLNSEVPCVSFYPSVISGANFGFKRLFDITFALMFLTLLSPVYLLLAIAIRLDSPGPIFYKQTRIGLHGNPFAVWKFRSMVQNADKLQAQLEDMNQTKDGVLFKIKADPRITRVGSFIRRYSLDELPQIFNVLLGEMSLVGPRPLPTRDVEKFKQHYFIRQDVLPGITGMWQVSGRSDIDNFDDVLKLDLHYIQNWSICLDISILFKTFAAVLKKSGAY